MQAEIDVFNQRFGEIPFIRHRFGRAARVSPIAGYNFLIILPRRKEK
ncbi:hypothetical protein [Propionivibrio sp.]|nr:hypothetical protein [Propionivibrio sp.]